MTSVNAVRMLRYGFTLSMVGLLLLVVGISAQAQPTDELRTTINQKIQEVMPEVIQWRRDIHAHPELSNREYRTARKVADHLRSIGVEVDTGVAHTGVVGVLRGAQKEPVVALRADMDALPVHEQTGLPYESEVTTTYKGQKVHVAHACGHDNHTAILMGVAEVLAQVRDQLPGTVKFIFQPAEEGAPAGERGGASLMIEEGVLQNPAPDAIFALHVWPYRVGTIRYRAGGAMASADEMSIVVRGKQTHGALPWGGTDPIVVGSQIVTSLQTIISRQVDITQAPGIVSIGSFHGGVRGNIIPDSVAMEGTVRAFNPQMRKDILGRIRRTVNHVAQSAGAEADVQFDPYAPVVQNDPELTREMVPTLERVAGENMVSQGPLITGAEDFAYYAREIPALYFFLGIVPEDKSPEEFPRNHSPYFYVDEDALPVGVRSMAHLAVDYLFYN